MAQLHKKFTDSQVKEILQRYLNSEIERPYIQQGLGIGKTRFFTLIKYNQADAAAQSLAHHLPQSCHSLRCAAGHFSRRAKHGELFLVFTLVLLTELYILLEIGSYLGALNTILLIIFTGILGAYLARLEGIRTIHRISQNLAAGVVPAEELVDEEHFPCSQLLDSPRSGMRLKRRSKILHNNHERLKHNIGGNQHG